MLAIEREDTQGNISMRPRAEPGVSLLLKDERLRSVLFCIMPLHELQLSTQARHISSCNFRGIPRLAGPCRASSQDPCAHESFRHDPRAASICGIRARGHQGEVSKRLHQPPWELGTVPRRILLRASAGPSRSPLPANRPSIHPGGVQQGEQTDSAFSPWS